MENVKNNIPEYSVSEFNLLIKETISSAFDMVKIRGEISNLKKPSSGHIYFTLKDEDSVINAVFFKNSLINSNFKIEEGMEIFAIGKISTFAKSISTYQIIISNIEIAGEGALLKIIENLKKKLMKNGYFDETKKLPIPQLPESIGIITSPTGSVIKDIIHRINDRFPLEIQLWPVPVQGIECSNKIIEAIKGFNDPDFIDKPDIIIITRGGGSIEDLMPFNDEELAKTIFYSKIPIISAIGHETDNPIIDYVSDLRAPTPSAAAEMSVPERKKLQKNLSIIVHNIEKSKDHILEGKKEHLNGLIRLIQDPSKVLNIFYSHFENLLARKEFGIKNLILKQKNKIIELSSNITKPFDKFDKKKSNFDNLFYKFNILFNSNFKNKTVRFENLARILNMSSLNVNLNRGYSIIIKGKKIISSTKDLKIQDIVDIKLKDGLVSAKIKKN